MALLATFAAFAAPTLSRSLRDRHVADEAARLVAASEWARNEAVSQGVPMVVWVDVQAARFGVEPKSGFFSETAPRSFSLGADIRVEIDKAEAQAQIAAIEFAPDGSLETGSAASIRLIDRFDGVMTVAQAADGWSYEIVRIDE